MYNAYSSEYICIHNTTNIHIFVCIIEIIETENLVLGQK